MQAPGTGTSSGLCFGCGQPGHFKRNCPNGGASTPQGRGGGGGRGNGQVQVQMRGRGGGWGRGGGGGWGGANNQGSWGGGQQGGGWGSAATTPFSPVASFGTGYAGMGMAGPALGFGFNASMPQTQAQHACAAVGMTGLPITEQWKLQRLIMGEDKRNKKKESDKEARKVTKAMLPTIATMMASQLTASGQLSADEAMVAAEKYLVAGDDALGDDSSSDDDENGGMGDQLAMMGQMGMLGGPGGMGAAMLAEMMRKKDGDGGKKERRLKKKVEGAKLAMAAKEETKRVEATKKEHKELMDTLESIKESGAVQRKEADERLQRLQKQFDETRTDGDDDSGKLFQTEATDIMLAELCGGNDYNTCRQWLRHEHTNIFRNNYKQSKTIVYAVLCEEMSCKLGDKEGRLQWLRRAQAKMARLLAAHDVADLMTETYRMMTSAAAYRSAMLSGEKATRAAGLADKQRRDTKHGAGGQPKVSEYMHMHDGDGDDDGEHDDSASADDEASDHDHSESEVLDDDEFEVEAIIKDKKSKGISLMLVKYKDYSEDHATWCPMEDLLDTAPTIVFEYFKKKMGMERETIKKKEQRQAKAAAKEKEEGKMERMRQQAATAFQKKPRAAPAAAAPKSAKRKPTKTNKKAGRGLQRALGSTGELLASAALFSAESSQAHQRTVRQEQDESMVAAGELQREQLTAEGADADPDGTKAIIRAMQQGGGSGETCDADSLDGGNTGGEGNAGGYTDGADGLSDVEGASGTTTPDPEEVLQREIAAGVRMPDGTLPNAPQPARALRPRRNSINILRGKQGNSG